ncbi:MAG: phenylalanine--tRNA ligase subunit beta, partial [Thermodesulfobacteriota bacterium]|nr:phenylalanine--tRNA ligase subunit beta [Thermodesulfobacteriota bacterium]
RNLGIINATFTAIEPDACSYTKPGYSARIIVDNNIIGLIGEVHPLVLQNYDLKQKACVFELDFDKLTGIVPDIKTAKPIPKFPATSRDVTLIVDKDIEAMNILQLIEDLDEDIVENLHLFDVYEGSPVPAGKKSISFRIIYRLATQTLEDEAVNLIQKEITGRLIKEFDASLSA